MRSCSASVVDCGKAEPGRRRSEGQVSPECLFQRLLFIINTEMAPILSRGGAVSHGFFMRIHTVVFDISGSFVTAAKYGTLLWYGYGTANLINIQIWYDYRIFSVGSCTACYKNLV